MSFLNLNLINRIYKLLYIKKEIAEAMGKDTQYVRVGIQQGILKFGGGKVLEGREIRASYSKATCSDKC